MVFTERGAAAEMPAEDAGCWDREKKRVSVEHFINYCFFSLYLFTLAFFRTCSSFFYSTAQMLK